MPSSAHPHLLREVVTVFLSHAGKVLVLKRSGRVGTYQGRWAGVSGYLEGSVPLAQAYTELEEEVGLGKDQVRLIKAGIPAEVVDEREGRAWRVYPFLFAVHEPERIKLDWENTEMRWVHPSEISRLQTVPGLADVLQQVLRPMDWLDRKIDAIARDRRHGAAQLADKALDVLVALCRHGKASTPENLAHQVVAIAMRLAGTRPSMAAIHNWCLLFAHRFTSLAQSAAGLKELRGQGVQLGVDLRTQRQSLLRQQIEAARPLLTTCRSLVTLSYSSTVEAILRDALPERSRVTIAESRPLLEGRRLFTMLLESHPSVRMVTDAQLGLTIPAADLVFVGADSILSDLSVVNKAGTYLAALVAKAHHRPFYVAADTFKIQATVDSRTCILESKPGREVWPRHARSSDNVYFDITPGRLVSGFLTESGILDGPGMAARVQGWKELLASLRV